MKPPHPWLARLATAGMAGAVAAGLAGVAATLLPDWPGGGWYGGRVVNAWQQAATPVAAAWVARWQLDGLAAAVAGPTGWLLAAAGLRLAAAGRLTAPDPLARRLRASRWATVAGMTLGGLATASGAAWWANPDWPIQSASPPRRIDQRVRQRWADGYVDFHQFDPVPNESVRGTRTMTGPLAPDPVRRAGLLAAGEGVALFTAVRGPGLVFLLCGTAYCLGRRPEGDS